MGQCRCSRNSSQFRTARTTTLVHKFVESVQLSPRLKRWNGGHAREASNSKHSFAVHSFKTIPVTEGQAPKLGLRD